MTSYLTSSEADTLADALPGLASYKALNDAGKTAVLMLATLRIDARKFQGRKYDTTGAQANEFPRVPYPAPSAVVWDWVSDAAAVPDAVKLAVLFEADSIANGQHDAIQAAIARGLTAQSTGGLSESYNAAMAATAGQTPCPESQRLIAKYLLRTGGIL